MMPIGLPLGETDFFVPKPEFCDWVAKLAGPHGIVEAGCGRGLFAMQLLQRKVDVLAMDAATRPNELVPVLRLDATTHTYESTDTVFVCRPCHGYFPDALLARVLIAHAAMYYVGLEKNIERDIDDEKYDTEVVYENCGEDGEVCLLVVPKGFGSSE